MEDARLKLLKKTILGRLGTMYMLDPILEVAPH